MTSGAFGQKSEDPAQLEAQKLMERASKLKAEGRYDEARELADKADKLRGEHREHAGKKKEGPPPPEHFARAKKEIEELHRAGKHEEAEQLKRRIAEFHEHGKALPKGPGADRLRHLMEAIHHLREADLPEPAERLEQMAREMQVEMAKQREVAEHAGHPPKHHPPVDEIRRLQEQIEKMAHAIEELRAQARKHHGEEVKRPDKP